MVVQARKLDHLKPHTSSKVSSLLLDPLSRSLALMLSNSSIVLYPSVSLDSSLPAPSSTFIPAVCSASTFFRLQDHSKSNPRVLFLTAGPSRSLVNLRAWILFPRGTYRRVYFNFQNSLKPSADLGLSQVHSITLSGSVNVFLLYSLAESRICIFSMKLIEEDKVNLIKCVTLECTVPVYSLKVSMGLLVIGEENGVRVFQVKSLLKGRTVRGKAAVDLSSADPELAKSFIPSRKNGVIGELNAIHDTTSTCARSQAHASLILGIAESSSHHCQSAMDSCPPSARQKDTEMGQVSALSGSLFFSLKCPDRKNSNCERPVLGCCVKAVSIHPLYHRRFLILDSDGGMHLLNFHGLTAQSRVGVRDCSLKTSGELSHLGYSMKVEMAAVLPDVASRTQNIWLSDGCHSVHLGSIMGLDSAGNENDKIELDEIPTQITATHAIFTSEKIQDIVPFTSNAVLILEQGTIFGYTA